MQIVGFLTRRLIYFLIKNSQNSHEISTLLSTSGCCIPNEVEFITCSSDCYAIVVQHLCVSACRFTKILQLQNFKDLRQVGHGFNL